MDPLYLKHDNQGEMPDYRVGTRALGFSIVHRLRYKNINDILKCLFFDYVVSLIVVSMIVEYLLLLSNCYREFRE